MVTNEIEVNEGEINVYELYLVIKKRRPIVLACIILSSLIAVAYILISPNSYKVSNVVVIDPTASFGVDEFNVFLADRDILQLLKLQKLDLDNSFLDKVLEVKISPFKKNARALQIDVTALDKETGARLIKLMPHYLQTRPFIMNKIGEQKKILQENINDLDEFKKNPIKQLNGSGNMFLIGSEIYSLHERYNQYCSTLEKHKNLQLVTLAGDTPLPTKPNKPKKLMVTLIGVFMGLFIGVCIALIMEWHSFNHK